MNTRICCITRDRNDYTAYLDRMLSTNQPKETR